MVNSQANRAPITTAHTSAASPTSSAGVLPARPSTTTGSCSPTSTNSVALSRKVSTSHTANAWRRVGGEASSGARQPR